MDEKEREKRQFPKEYESIEDLVLEAQQRIREIDEAIKNLPPDRGNVPDFRPNGAPPVNRTAKETIIKGYEAQKENIKKTTLEQVNEKVSVVDPKLAKKIMDKTSFLLDETNNYRDMKMEELKSKRGEEKKEAVSQKGNGGKMFGYMDKLYYDSMKFPNDNEPEKPKEAKHEKNSPKSDLLNKFLDNTHFTKAEKETVKEAEPSKETENSKETQKEKDPAKDDNDFDKDE